MERPSTPADATRTPVSGEFCLNLSQTQQVHDPLALLQHGNIKNEHNNSNDMSSVTSPTAQSQLLNEVQPATSLLNEIVAEHQQKRQYEALESQCLSTSNDNQLDQPSTADISTLQALGAAVNVNEKIAIYRHPLFPLLRVLFEKCEIATNSIENVSSMNFQEEIKNSITQMAKENKPFFTDDVEVDTLMLKALQVLTIHLLELEKVNELCKDFCTRYISCLKGKLNSENIMRTLDIQNTPPASPIQQQPKEDILMGPAADSPTLGEATSEHSTIDASMLASPHPSILNSTTRSASTSFMEIETTKGEYLMNRSTSIDSSHIVSTDLASMTVGQLTSGFLTKKNKGGKRGTLPKVATNVLKAWLFQHLVHPYPSEEEKKQLAQQTNLSILQVNNWFINARRKIIQPMLDSSNTLLKNNKKSKQPRNAAQKDWSNTMDVYNALHLTGSATTTTQLASPQQQSVGLVVSPIVPAPGTMLLNIGENTSTNQPVLITQPLQFVQVNHMPAMQAIAPSGYLPLHTVTTQATSTVATSQQQQLTPIGSLTTEQSKQEN